MVAKWKSSDSEGRVFHQKKYEVFWNIFIINFILNLLIYPTYLGTQINKFILQISLKKENKASKCFFVLFCYLGKDTTYI